MSTRHILFFLFSICILASFSCLDDEPTTPPNDALFIVSQGEALLDHGGSLLFVANKPVDWYVSDTLGGTIDDTGIYKAPSKSGAYRVTAISRENSTETATAEILVTKYRQAFLGLRNGGYVIYFRHAIADSGSDRSNLSGQWWKSCSPDTARQLSAAGNEQALQIGTVIRRLQIPISNITSSEYCRCFTTAEIMNLGVEVQTDTAITFAVYDEPNRHPNTLRLITTQKPDLGKNSVLVSHSYGSGFPPLLQVGQGDAAIFLPKQSVDPQFVVKIPADEWTSLYRKP